MAVFRLTFTQTVMGITMNSVHHYSVSGASASHASALVSGFQTEWLNAYHGLQNVGVEDVSVYAINVADAAQWALASGLTGNGDVGTPDSCLPPKWAINFTGNCVGSVIRHSFKRISGIDEEMITSGEVDTGYIAACDVFRSKMIATISSGGFSFVPHSARYTEPPDSHFSISAAITSATLTGVSTQRSRR